MAAVPPLDDDNDIIVHDNVPSYDVAVQIQQSATENEEGETLRQQQEQQSQLEGANVTESHEL